MHVANHTLPWLYFGSQSNSFLFLFKIIHIDLFLKDLLNQFFYFLKPYLVIVILKINFIITVNKYGFDK